MSAGRAAAGSSAVRALRALAIAFALASSGCATVLDLEGARRYFEGDPAPVPALPPLVDDEDAELASVSGLRATGGELRSVPLLWEPLLAGDVAGYVVERALDAQSPFERVAQVAGRFGTTYVDRGSDLAAKHQGVNQVAGLGDGETYLYRVRALAVSGQIAAAPTDFVEATTAAAPDPPAALEAYSRLPRRVALRWDPAPDPTVGGYRIYRSPSARGEYLAVTDIDGRFTTTWMDAGLGNLRVFYYRVASINLAGGEGEPTAPERAVTKPDPLPPDDLRLAGQELGRNRMAWAANVEPDLVAYRLLRRRDGQEPDEVVGTFDADVLEATDEAIGAGEAVSYALVAVDRDGLESVPSKPVSVESVDYGLSATARGSEVLLSWDPSLHGPLDAMRILLIGTFSTQQLAELPSEGWVHRSEEEGGLAGRTLRYQLIGVRPDGSLAPASAVVSIDVPE